jgi:predicted DNA-binding transcriptional regulator AlpA
LVLSKAFPAPVRLGRQAYWIEPVVDHWIDARLYEQRAWLEGQAAQY